MLRVTSGRFSESTSLSVAMDPKPVKKYSEFRLHCGMSLVAVVTVKGRRKEVDTACTCMLALISKGPSNATGIPMYVGCQKCGLVTDITNLAPKDPLPSQHVACPMWGITRLATGL